MHPDESCPGTTWKAVGVAFLTLRCAQDTQRLLAAILPRSVWGGVQEGTRLPRPWARLGGQDVMLEQGIAGLSAARPGDQPLGETEAPREELQREASPVTGTDPQSRGSLVRREVEGIHARQPSRTPARQNSASPSFTERGNHHGPPGGIANPDPQLLPTRCFCVCLHAGLSVCVVSAMLEPEILSVA